MDLSAKTTIKIDKIPFARKKNARTIKGITMNKVLEEAIATYGAKNQIIVAIEELAELQKELCKFLRDNKTDNIAEEIADVTIMLDQMIMLFSSQETIESWRKSKLERLEKRINGNF